MPHQTPHGPELEPRIGGRVITLQGTQSSSSTCCINKIHKTQDKWVASTLQNKQQFSMHYSCDQSEP